MRRISDSSDSPVAHWDVALDRIDTEVLSYVTSICDLCLGTSTTPTRDDIQKKPIGIAKLTVIYRLDFELGNAEDGETPAVEAGRGSGSFGVLSLVSPANCLCHVLPDLSRDFASPPCNRTAYSSSWRKNPIFGLTIPRFALTAASASSGVILIVAMRYAHTMAALRLMPIKQWTRTRELGSSASALRMNEVATGRCVRISWSALSDSGICSVRSDCDCGRVGACSMTETTWVIPRLVSCASSRAVKRSVRYNRGSTSLAISPRRKCGRRPLRCCAAAMRDVCQG